MSPVRTLAQAQFQADLRHPGTGRRAGGRLAMTLFAYGVSGTVLALALGNAAPENALFVAGSFGMVLAAFGIVGSYDDLMGRPRDNAWLATLPASETQHYAARLIGISGYVVLMAVGVAAPVAVRSGVAHGPALGATIGLVVGAGVAWTAALCLAALWGVTLAIPPRVLRPALTVVRTLLVGALVIGYQWIGAEPTASRAAWWPGAWLAETLSGRPSTGVLALLLSGAAMGVALGVVFPRRYFRLLDRLAHGQADAERRGRADRRLLGVERRLAPAGPARAAYGFAVAAMSDDRVVAGRLWPAALLPLGFVVFGWMAGGLGSLVGQDPVGALTSAETSLHLSVLVVLLFSAQTLVQTIQQSDHAAAAWVFGTLPHVRPRALQMGAQAALAVRVLVPLSVAMWAVLSLQMTALDAALHALYWLAVVTVATRLHALAYRTPPFSRHSERFGAGARLTPLFVSLPGALLAMLVQTLAFQTRPRALAVSLVLLVGADLVGRLVVRGARRAPAPRPSDVAEASPAVAPTT